MAHANGKITAPVGIDSDIPQVLGVASTDLGYLCSNAHERINIWSRRKPVQWNSMDINLTNPTWWKAQDGNCGLVPKSISSYKDLVDAMDNDMNGWVYVPPTGGNVPYRALDFDGYYHNARAIFGNMYVPSTATNQFSSSSFGVSMAIYDSSDDNTDELQARDITAIKDCYFGAYVQQNGGTQYRRATSPDTIGNGSSMVTINSYGMPAGTWTVYPFLSTTKMAQDDLEQARILYTIPKAQYKSIKIVRSYISVNIRPGMLPSGGGFVDVEIVVINSSGSSITMSNNTWMTRFGNNNMYDPMQIGELSGKIPDFTVPANQTTTIQVTVQVTYELAQQFSAKLWILLNSGNYTYSSVFMTPVPNQ